MKGMSVSYDAVKCEVSITVPFDPSEVGSTDHRWMDDDFFGSAVRQDGKATIGPFQNLKQGVNTFRVWGGMDVPGAGELPEGIPH